MDPPMSVSQVLGLWVCATTAGFEGSILMKTNTFSLVPQARVIQSIFSDTVNSVQRHQSQSLDLVTSVPLHLPRSLCFLCCRGAILTPVAPSSHSPPCRQNALSEIQIPPRCSLLPPSAILFSFTRTFGVFRVAQKVPHDLAQTSLSASSGLCSSMTKFLKFPGHTTLASFLCVCKHCCVLSFS